MQICAKFFYKAIYHWDGSKDMRSAPLSLRIRAILTYPLGVQSFISRSISFGIQESFTYVVLSSMNNLPSPLLQ